jgi:hypothetical protein
MPGAVLVLLKRQQIARLAGAITTSSQLRARPVAYYKGPGLTTWLAVPAAPAALKNASLAPLCVCFYLFHTAISDKS